MVPLGTETGFRFRALLKVTHREGEHDDMAICVASTNWWANLPKPRGTRVITDERVLAKLMGYPTSAERKRGPESTAPVPLRMPSRKKWSA